MSNSLSLSVNSNRGLAESEKTMTMQQIADAIGVSYDTINRCVKRIFPDKLQHGKVAHFDEKEVACISKELKNNTSVLSHQTVAVSATVKNSTTRTEILENYKAATQAFVELIAAEKEELRKRAELAESSLSRLTNASGEKTVQEVAKILGYGSNNFYALLRGMGIFYKDNGINLPKQEYINSGYFIVKVENFTRNGEDCTYSRIFVTAKGLTWLEKKTKESA